MDFNDTPEEAAFRAEVRAWLEANAERRTGAEISGNQDLPARIARARAYQQRKVAAGYAAMTLPRAYGGGGGTAIRQVIFAQEEAAFDNCGVVDFFGIGLGMCLPTILHNGTEEQRERYLAPGIRGEEIWCQLFSEPSGGSDAAAARTSAVREGEGWRITGQKVWTSGAHFSDFGIITTRTDPTLPKHRGMTMFIVDMKAPGVEVRPIRQMSGEGEFNEVFFTDVFVPDNQRLGAVNDGWSVALSTLMHERAGIGGRSGDLGWRRMLELAEETLLDGRPAVDDWRVAGPIVDSFLTEFGARLIGFRGQTALSKGEQPGPEQTILKMLKAPLIQQHAYRAMDLLGEAGVLTPETLGDDWREIERAWTFGAGLRIAGGSDEILRNIVAERVLGLPPDVRLDKGVPFNEIPG
jgi:alkylation response protein AidB-like acyl-CoA dehydrogenase